MSLSRASDGRAQSRAARRRCRSARNRASETVVAVLLVAALRVVVLTSPLQAQGTDTGRATRGDTAKPTMPRDTGQRVTAPATPSADAAGAEQSAQVRDTGGASSAPADTAVQRVRALVAEGQTTAARTLVDSLLASTPPASLAYPSILYTRATLATNADSAENDYRRVIVEYAGSPQAADALLRLAQLELARGDRQQAAAHLARLSREQLPNQTGIAFARTQLQVGLAYFDLQDTTRACVALAAASGAAPSTDVELRNRIDYNTKRCVPAGGGVASNASADSTRKAGGAPPHGVDSAKTKSTRGATPPAKGASHAAPPAAAPAAAPAGTPSAGTPPAGTPPAGANAPARRVRAPGFTVQVAAYQTQSAAQALVEHLRARGFVARIYGSGAPFRIRVGRFSSETQADSAARSLKSKGITGFVTPAEMTE